MSYSIIRLEKIKHKENVAGIQRHVQRENKNYNNKDIDHEKTHLNYDLLNEVNINYIEQSDNIIKENYKGKRKIRKDAIRNIDGIITSDNTFFEKMSDEETKEFFEHSLEFLKESYGEENLVYATVHMDEKTPHMHFGFVPMTLDGRLSAKDVVGNKKRMTMLQDEFNAYINEKGYDLERGTSKLVSQKEHVEIDQFKKETEYHAQAVIERQEELEVLNLRKSKKRRDMDELERSSDVLEKDIESLEAKKQKLQENIRNLTKEFNYTEDDLVRMHEKESYYLSNIEHNSVLYPPVEYEKNVFGRETGNVIINETAYKSLAEDRASLYQVANKFSRYKRIYPAQEYDLLKRSEYMKEEKAQQEDALRKENQSLRREVEDAKETADKWRDNYFDLRNACVRVYQQLDRHIPDFDKKYKSFTEKMPESFKKVKKYMQHVQTTVFKQRNNQRQL